MFRLSFPSAACAALAKDDKLEQTLTGHLLAA